MYYFIKVAFLWLLSCSAYAISTENFPSNFSITEFPCTTQCFELKNSNTREKIGSLVPDTELKGTYLFKDNLEQTQITIQYAGKYGDALTFNVYDNRGQFLSRFLIEGNPMGGSALNLLLYEIDWSTAKTHISSNPIGTHHSLYKGRYFFGKTALVHLTRPIFSLKTDSQVSIEDREQLFSFLEPNLFAALSAFHCINKPYFEIDPGLRNLQIKTKNFLKNYPYNDQSVDLAQLKSISDILNTRFQEQYQDVVFSYVGKTQKFVEFVCDLIQAHDFLTI